MPASPNSKISIIIPVYREEKGINSIISRLRKIQQNQILEIIIVDSGEGESTLKAVEDSDIIKLSSKKGRAIQMNLGASIATGDILLFLHADTVLPNDVFMEINNSLKSGRYVAGAFTLSFDNNRFAFRLIAYVAGIRYRITRIPFGDQSFFILKEYFNRIGKYSEIPLMEDVDLMKRIKESGDKIYISDKKVITSARKWERDGIFYSNMRNWVIQLLYLAGMPPEKLVKYYYRETSN